MRAAGRLRGGSEATFDATSRAAVGADGVHRTESEANQDLSNDAIEKDARSARTLDQASLRDKPCFWAPL